MKTEIFEDSFFNFVGGSRRSRQSGTECSPKFRLLNYVKIKGKNWYGLNFPRQLALWSHWPVQTITISGSSFRVVTELRNSTFLEKSFTSTPTARDWSLANCLSFTRSRLYILCFLPHHLLHIFQTTTFCACLDRCQFWKSVNHGGCQRKRMTVIRQGILFFCLIHGQG